MYMIVLIIKIIDWNRFANQLIDTSKDLQCITHRPMNIQEYCFHVDYLQGHVVFLLRVMRYMCVVRLLRFLTEMSQFVQLYRVAFSNYIRPTGVMSIPTCTQSMPSNMYTIENWLEF